MKQLNYRPQTKFAKVMFLHLSVSHSVHRGGGIPACIAGGIPACLAVGRSPGSHLGGKLGLARGGVSRTTPGGVSRPTPGGVSRPTTWGLCVSQHALRQTPHLLWMATATGGMGGSGQMTNN